MKPSEVTVEWLKQQKFEIKPALFQPTIEGVHLKELNAIVDGRGDVIELWNEAWKDSDGVIVPRHIYQSATDFGVIKCWHLHESHTDQFTVTRGKLQVSLVDIRPDSPTFGQANAILLGTQRPRYLRIPPGIMHGWKALSEPEVIVVNLQTEPYDPADEFKFPWDSVLTEIWEPRNG